MGRNLKILFLLNFFNKHGIAHEFFAPKTPQQNGVVKRKNRPLQKMARVMLNSKNLSSRLQAKAVNTAHYTINRVFLRPGTNKISYKIQRGKKPNLSHFHVFGCTCYILNDREQLGKFQAKSDKNVFLDYSTNSRAYRIFNLRTKIIMKSINVVIDNFNDFTSFSSEDEGIYLTDEVESQLQKINVTPNDVTQGVQEKTT